MTDHTPTPEPVCGARHHDAVNAALVCELPPGHGAYHRAQTTPGEYFNWLAAPEAAPEPVASGQPDVGVSWRTIAGRAEAALDAHRLAMAKALALATSTPWGAIEERAHELAAMHAGGRKGRTASDVLVEHDVTRKALCDALDAGYHLNWQQLVDVAQRHHDANGEWQQEMEQHRTAVSEALGLGSGSGWDAIQDCAAKTRKAAKERAAALQDARDELAAAGYPTDSNGWLILAPAIRRLAADVKLLRGNSEVDRREASNRREALAKALGLGTGAGWDAVTDRARKVTAERDAARAGGAPWARAYREDLEDAKKRAKEAEEGERRAMRQRQEMAEERYALQQRADLADRVKRTAAKDAAYALKRAEQAEATIARARKALAEAKACGGEDAGCTVDHRDIITDILDGEQPGAEPAPASSEVCCVCGSRNVLHQVAAPTRLCGDCFLCHCGETPCVRTGINDPAVSAEPEAPCFHPSWETEPTVGARRCTDCGEWLDPQPVPAKPDGAALWAAIRDHAFNDTQWWRKVNRRRDHAQLNTYVQRGPGHTPTR